MSADAGNFAANLSGVTKLSIRNSSILYIMFPVTIWHTCSYNKIFNEFVGQTFMESTFFSG